MGRPKLRRPSLGTVLGLTALIVAVVGTANASPGRIIVRKGDIAKGAVTANSLAPGSVHAKALAKGAVTAKALAGAAVGASALAPDAVTSNAVAPGSIYGGALGPVDLHTSPIADTDAIAENGTWTASAVVSAACAAGERLLSGGVLFGNVGNREVGILKSVPSNNEWIGQITSNSGGTATAEVQAVCLK
jgi:hypothetical protein